jgi:hypothetical protein
MQQLASPMRLRRLWQYAKPRVGQAFLPVRNCSKPNKNKRRGINPRLFLLSELGAVATGFLVQKRSLLFLIRTGSGSDRVSCSEAIASLSYQNRKR